MSYLSIKDFNIYNNLDNVQSYLLIIKNKRYLYSLINDMKNDCSEMEHIQVFDTSNKKINNLETIEFVPSIFYLDINSKKNINILLKILKNSFKDQTKIIINSFTEELDKFFKNIRFDSPVSIVSDINIDENDLFKLLNISIKDDSISVLEKILNFIDVTFELRKIKVFIFYNLISFLEVDEVKFLIEKCKQLCISLVDIEYNCHIYKEFDVIKILDNDLCLLENI